MKFQNKHRLILDMEKWGLRIFDIFGRYNYMKTQKQLPTHNHSGMIEICYLSKGHQSYVVGENKYEVYGGDVFLTYPHEEHGTGVDPEEKGVLYWMVLRWPTPDENYIGLSYDDANELYRKLASIPNRLFKGGNKCEEILRKIFYLYYEEPTVMHRIEINNLLLSFLLTIIQEGSKTSKPPLNQRINDIIDYIDTHILETLELDMLAERMNLSLSRFKHVFKEEIGIPPSEYVTRKKLEIAKEYLAKDLSIKDIAYDVGFSSAAYFSTVFKQYYGCSPKEIRNNHNPKLPSSNT